MSVNNIRRRIPFKADLADFNRAFSLAWEKFLKNEYLDVFDICDDLVSAFPEHSASLLATVYDWYKKINTGDRYSLYQSRYFDFGIEKGQRVLDIGSGHMPFPFATDFADFAVDDDDYGRAGVPVKQLEGRDVYACNVENMPFADKTFDFVNCSHVLEHTEKPEKACEELMRVAKRGYIETPNKGKDLWLNSAAISNHRWVVDIENGILTFYEYSAKELAGFGSSILQSMHCAPQTLREKAFAAMIWLKSDQVNTMFMWDDQFLFQVYYQSGKCVGNVSSATGRWLSALGTETADVEEVIPADPYPRSFAVETVLGCNLKCPDCAIGGDIVTRKKGYLSLARFKVVMDKIAPYVNYLYLHLWGEPMLNPEIIPIIKYASRFTRTNISTNAVNLTVVREEELITSGVTDIIVSVDGISPETYDQYRIGGDVYGVLNSLRRLQELNVKNGSKVKIMPQFIVFEHNQHEMELFDKYCQYIGLVPLFKAPYIRKGGAIRLSSLKRYWRPEYKTKSALKQAMQSCSAIRNDFVVLLDGSVVVCCHDYDGLSRMGNIFEQRVDEIWQSPKYKEYRDLVKSGKAPDFCLDYCKSYILKKN